MSLARLSNEGTTRLPLSYGRQEGAHDWKTLIRMQKVSISTFHWPESNII